MLHLRVTCNGFFKISHAATYQKMEATERCDFNHIDTVDFLINLNSDKSLSHMDSHMVTILIKTHLLYMNYVDLPLTHI